MASTVYLLAKMMQAQALSKAYTSSSESTSTNNDYMFSMLLSALGGSGSSSSSSSTSDLLSGLLGLNTTSAAAAAANVTVSGAGQYEDIIQNAAARYGVDANLIKAIVQTESSYRADAVSGAGAQGLMQLMPRTAAGLGVTDPFDPEQNVNGGTSYIAQQINRFGDVRVALAAYNAGPGYIGGLGITDASDASQYERIPSGVRGYVDKVMARYEAYKAQA